jgi:hypothetical protein
MAQVTARDHAYDPDPTIPRAPTVPVYSISTISQVNCLYSAVSCRNSTPTVWHSSLTHVTRLYTTITTTRNARISNLAWSKSAEFSFISTHQLQQLSIWIISSFQSQHRDFCEKRIFTPSKRGVLQVDRYTGQKWKDGGANRTESGQIGRGG